MKNRMHRFHQPRRAPAFIRSLVPAVIRNQFITNDAYFPATLKRSFNKVHNTDSLNIFDDLLNKYMFGRRKILLQL